MFTRKPDPVSRVTEGQDATLMCRTFGAPRPKIVWSKGAEELTGQRYEIQENGDLVIKNVKDKDDEVCLGRGRMWMEGRTDGRTGQRYEIQENGDLVIKNVKDKDDEVSWERG